MRPCTTSLAVLLRACWCVSFDQQTRAAGISNAWMWGVGAADTGSNELAGAAVW